ncbi:TIGR01777 family oxidoreductase [Halalkalibacter kiskunsagensis]|uniref:TIGR01777 family oxidoreductase n=1 Tax=Halalkalibacter kiskunsagensis TaxID=1548599 RepID=A0ABV6KE17_9BACI
MNIAIAGGTGFLGTKLTTHLVEQGHTIFILTRDASNKPAKPHVHYVEWLNEHAAPEDSLGKLDAVINLAGESIGQGRWTSKRKEKILQSRIHSTRSVIALIKKLPNKPDVLVNASAIGYYGNSLTETFTEHSKPSEKNFLSHVVQEWEKKAELAKEQGVRVVCCRLGVVLDKEEGALNHMVLPYRLFIGGRLGSGKQWISWVHVDDAIRLFEFAMLQSSIEGAFNITAPIPLTMNEFGKIISTVLKKPHYLPTPAFVIKILLGDMSTLVLDGQKVLPNKAISLNYRYVFPTLNEALEGTFKL